MGKNNEKGINIKKGKKYEEFSQEILLLKELKWDYDENNTNICFDEDTGEHSIEGISGQKHQIDIHLTSSNNPQYHLLCECKAHKAAVEKTHACSFVTVIRDIADKHQDWKIIPVFIADDGFQSGAINILKYYKIIYLEMKDYRSAKRTVTTKIKSTALIYESIKGILANNSIVDHTTIIRNYAMGDYYIANIIGFFEILDKNDNVIENLVDYIGKFHTGKRTFKYDEKDENDEFIDLKSGQKLIRIEGEISGNKETQLGTSKTVYESKVITNIKCGDGSIYRINKDGTCGIIDENEAKKIFE